MIRLSRRCTVSFPICPKDARKQYLLWDPRRRQGPTRKSMFHRKSGKHLFVRLSVHRTSRQLLIVPENQHRQGVKPTLGGSPDATQGGDKRLRRMRA